jgi:hypothetical protein
MTSSLTRGGLAEQIMQRARISPLPTPPVLPLSGEERSDRPWRVRANGLIGQFLKQLQSNVKWRLFCQARRGSSSFPSPASGRGNTPRRLPSFRRCPRATPGTCDCSCAWPKASRSPPAALSMTTAERLTTAFAGFINRGFVEAFDGLGQALAVAVRPSASAGSIGPCNADPTTYCLAWAAR